MEHGFRLSHWAGLKVTTIMPNDPHFEDEQQPDNWEQNPDGTEIPASVTFMEMMRHAAAKAAPPTPSTSAEQLFARPRDAALPQTSTQDVETVSRSSAVPNHGAEQHREAAIEEQRVRRVKKRRARRRQRTVGVV